MEDELIIVRRYTDRLKAELARGRPAEQGVRCEVGSTRTSRHGDPIEFGILVPRDQSRLAAELLGPEPRPDAGTIRRGERSLQVALAVGGLILLVLLAERLLRG
ncbi:MAG: hypothetical protein SFX72_06090 [Isosphaeraceae bacterium]|nr:hypothetical protein [Isosphaeraceae bacterium]